MGRISFNAACPDGAVVSAGSSVTLRECAATLLLDVPRYLWHLSGATGWVRILNRNNSLLAPVAERGVALAEQWSSDLQACAVFPLLGQLVMRRALAEWPVRFGRAQECTSVPDISFVIPFRGKQRVPGLLATLATLFAQKGVCVECIVVEQAAEQVLKRPPAGITYIHLPHPDDPTGWHKSWAFNVGVQAARGEIVICHDADILAPEKYGREVLTYIREKGYDAVSLQRFLFCLDPEASELILSRQRPSPDRSPERIRQNWQGGTVAIRREAYFAIGGYDETFVGWGGEDNEFFDRLSSLRHWRHGYLPFIHLWHIPQPLKLSEERRRNEELFAARIAVPPADRSAALRRRNAGRGIPEMVHTVHAEKPGHPEKPLAVSLTFDDGLDVHLDHAAPMLGFHGFRGTFYTNISSPSLADRSAEWQSLAARGHELGNHTIFHPATEMKAWVTEGNALERYTLDRIWQELQVANTVLKILDGKSERTYAYPCSNPILGHPGFVKRLLRALNLDRTRLVSWCTSLKLLDIGASERDYAYLLSGIFLAARIGGAATFTDECSHTDRYRVSCVSADGKNAAELIDCIEKARGAQQWLVLMFHGIGGGHHLSVELSEFATFLSYLADQHIRVRTFIDAANYTYYCGD